MGGRLCPCNQKMTEQMKKIILIAIAVRSVTTSPAFVQAREIMTREEYTRVINNAEDDVERKKIDL